jgi:alpha-beta hydrolase superfamily lysophospholipase
MSSTPSTHVFSKNADRDYEIRCAVGHSVEGAGIPGEILAAVTPVQSNDHEGWYQAWWRLAERSFGIAQAARAAEHRESAAEAFLRASAYYGVAVNAISALAESDRLAPTFARQQEAWSGFIATTPVSVEELSIPYDGESLPGWFFRPDRPSGRTLIAVNGSDGSRASVWASCVASGLRRGYNVLVFDGPGQQSQIFEKGVPFRFDWEHVLTPVYDFIAARDGVDESKIAVYGISQGGYWVARALAFEHRFAAGVTDPGIVDVSESWTSHLPKNMLKLLDDGSTQKFDRQMALGMKFSPGTARTWRFRARPYGTEGYAETIEAVRAYNVIEVAGQITTPLLILSPEQEQFWPGQAERLAELTSKVSTLVPFTAEEGAAEHCQPLARGLAAQRMFDWLDEQLA